jgi:hypothetical protein
LFARIDGFVNEKPDTGIKRIVNRMGSEDLVVERRIELFQGYKDADRCVRGSLERVLKAWLMFQGTGPVKR